MLKYLISISGRSVFEVEIVKWVIAICALMLLAACTGTNPPVSTPDVEQTPSQITPSCPSCDDGDACTDDQCGAGTNYSCEHTTIAPCCGNGICEEPETPSTCSDDCPACNAAKCVRASYDYTAQRCVTEPITPCCGNGICESTETRCIEDCPNCTTTDKCMAASFDKIQKRCVTKPIVPCCGNNICDRGESCSSCDDDCDCETSTDLSDYPEFLHDGTKIIVGDNATSRDVLTASSLTTALAVDGIDTESNILSEFGTSTLSKSDLIVIGDPCLNELWERYQGVACDAGFFRSGTALIKLVKENDRYIVYVAGDTPTDTQKAAEALNKHKSYGFEGMETELDTTGSSAKII
jgi:hypothetical protein